MDFYYLIDARTEGGVVVLRFYNSETDETVETRDLNYKPYFFLPDRLSKTDKEQIRDLHGEMELVKKRDLFTNELRELTKVTVHTPEALRKAKKTFENAWETEIEYTQSYIYDHDMIFGASHVRKEDLFALTYDTPQALARKFEETFADIEVIHPQKHAQIKYWFNLIHQPIPQLNPQLLGTSEVDSQRFNNAFALARIANIPVTEAYQSRRVSDWLKSIIHTYLRRNGFLIPTSRELRRGLETHRVPGALTVTPKEGVYFNTVVCDFESLYPSCIDSYNLSYETVNCSHEECRRKRIEECPDHWVCTERRGFYSDLVGALKDLRVRWFKPLSKDKEASQKERKTAQDLEKLLKLISVSGYGVTVRIHGLACPPLAECITGYGRWVLQTTWDIAEANALHPIYGDTDSIFLDNPQPVQVEQLMKIVKERLKLDIAIEKQYSLCALPAAKKAYFGILLDGKPDVKGLTVIKSNSPKIIQKVFQDCIGKLRNVKNPEEYELAKETIAVVIQQAVKELQNHKVHLEDLMYSVKLYYDPAERQAANVKVTPQPYQCAIQLLDAKRKVKRGDTMHFIKVKPFNYKGKMFTVKPAEFVKSVMEINVEDYIRNLKTALNQTFAPMGIQLEQKPETKISDWFKN